MGFKSYIEIAQECEMRPITEIAAKAGIDDKYLEQYGKYKAKIDYNLLKETNAEDGKLILVTAINPTPAGEGKTTTSVGLADALSRMGKKTILALREPSLGPVLGMKGGAAGGGKSSPLRRQGKGHVVQQAQSVLRQPGAPLEAHLPVGATQGQVIHVCPLLPILSGCRRRRPHGWCRRGRRCRPNFRFHWAEPKALRNP